MEDCAEHVVYKMLTTIDILRSFDVIQYQYELLYLVNNPITRGYSSVVEHSTDREVTGANPVVPLKTLNVEIV